jgi:hypothetical protein
MAYSLLSTGIDDLEDHQEYAAYLSPSSTTFEHNSCITRNSLFQVFVINELLSFRWDSWARQTHRPPPVVRNC